MATITLQGLSLHAHYRARCSRSNHGPHSHHRFSSSHSANSLRSDLNACSTTGRGLLRRLMPPSPLRLRTSLVTTCALDAGPSPGEGRGEPVRLGSNRLRRIIQTGSQNLVKKFNSGRKNFPMKIFLLLLGFYSANALATVLGQTGDWDVLAAGILVAVIEGVGYLMYRMPPFLGERGADIVLLANYFKSGLSFGLFVDAFKLGS